MQLCRYERGKNACKSTDCQKVPSASNFCLWETLSGQMQNSVLKRFVKAKHSMLSIAGCYQKREQKGNSAQVVIRTFLSKIHKRKVTNVHWSCLSTLSSIQFSGIGNRDKMLTGSSLISFPAGPLTLFHERPTLL